MHNQKRQGKMIVCIFKQHICLCLVVFAVFNFTPVHRSCMLKITSFCTQCSHQQTIQLMLGQIFWSISLMYNTIINGLKTIPCGIPDLRNLILCHPIQLLLSFNHLFSYPIQENILFQFGKQSLMRDRVKFFAKLQQGISYAILDQMVHYEIKHYVLQNLTAINDIGQ